MKKIIVVFALLLSLSAIAQDFPGKYIDLLLDKDVKVKELKGKYAIIGYEFYIQPEFGNENIYAPLEGKGKTNPEAVVGRQFKVEKIIDNSKFDVGYYWIKLTDGKETLYISYNVKSDYKFPFTVIGGLKLPADFYCDYVTERTDKFKGEIIFTGKLEAISFLKVKKEAGAKYYMSINAPLDNKVGKKGVIVLLTGNKRIEKPNLEFQILGDQNKHYNATFELSLKELNLLIDNTITDTRVGTYDSEIENGVQLKGILDCLITK
jgi:hypothetical protein